MTNAGIKTQPASLKQYFSNSGWQLIPLHKFDTTDTFKGRIRQRGKSPIDPKWTTGLYKNSEQLAHMQKGFNVGVRLKANQLVVDVDPRNFGPTAETKDLPKDQWVMHSLSTPGNPFEQLCIDCRIDPDNYPTVETGSGGLHVYMTKPGDIPVKDSHPEYPGIEFKTIGRQVVSAGSVHPDTRKLYAWNPFAVDLAEIKPAPDFLINIIARPKAAAQLSGGGGEYTPEQIETMLNALNPEDFQDYTAWLTLMQACHYASHGEARIEFVEWSISDPAYSNAANEIGQKWDGFHMDKPGPKITTQTLHKIMHDAGQREAIPRRTAADDFAEDDPDVEEMIRSMGEAMGDEKPAVSDKGEGEEVVDPLSSPTPGDKLNERYWAAMDGGKFKVYHQTKDMSFSPPRKYWSSSSSHDFKEFWNNFELIPQGKEKPVKLGNYWMEWPKRNSVQNIMFDPSNRQLKGTLNLWTGWAMNAKKKEGGWALLDELIRDTLCNGDMAVYEYVLNWCAYLFQYPARPAEVAIAFQGDKGTGKGTLGRTLTTIAGAHGMAISSAAHFTGRFNSHLRDVVMLFADEAVKTEDKNARSQLKALITEPVVAFEGKGANIVSGKNHLHVMIASNEDRFVPAGYADGERRYMIQKVSNNRQGDHAFFKRLNAQLKNGGNAAFLWDMQHRELGEWHPRNDIPITEEAINQSNSEASATQNWWMGILAEGKFETIAPVRGSYLTWPDEPLRVLLEDLRKDFEDFCARHYRNDRTVRPGDHDYKTTHGKELAALLPDGYNPKMRDPIPEDRPDIVSTDTDGRVRSVSLPSLSACRAHYDKRRQSHTDWYKA